MRVPITIWDFMTIRSYHIIPQLNTLTIKEAVYIRFDRYLLFIFYRTILLIFIGG